jgi:TRAP-type C4-dicarboxylate transport system permease small subunit
MALCVFLQFFTRYVLNDSFAWTEEIATYCLVVIVFLGSSMCVRLSRHIQVDFLYRYLPPGGGALLSTGNRRDPRGLLRLRHQDRLSLHSIWWLKSR